MADPMRRTATPVTAVVLRAAAEETT